MKKRVVREWTCDKCGKTIEGYMIFRPFGIEKSRIHIELGLYYYGCNKDLCSDCAKELIEIVDDYWRK